MKREKLDEKYEKPYFLSVGRFTKQKNHEFLLKFFEKFKLFTRYVSNNSQEMENLKENTEILLIKTN